MPDYEAQAEMEDEYGGDEQQDFGDDDGDLYLDDDGEDYSQPEDDDDSDGSSGGTSKKQFAQNVAANIASIVGEDTIQAAYWSMFAGDILAILFFHVYIILGFFSKNPMLHLLPKWQVALLVLLDIIIIVALLALIFAMLLVICKFSAFGTVIKVANFLSGGSLPICKIFDNFNI